jgi:engulfment and cell motility protein 1
LKIVLEQLAKPPQLRCPIAKASVAITSLLYEQFSLSAAIDTPAPISPSPDTPIPDAEQSFQPLYLQWLRIHSATVKAFLRLWRDTGAESLHDLPKIIELTRVLLLKTVKQGTRDLEIYDIEQAIEDGATNWRALRREQMDAREGEHERAWGESLALLTERLQREAEEFIREQRISCLLQGEWFKNPGGVAKQGGAAGERDGAATPTPLDPKRGMKGGRWRYVRLKGDRKTLCWEDFQIKKEGRKIRLDELTEHGKSHLSKQYLMAKVDLSKVVQVAFSSHQHNPSDDGVDGVNGLSHLATDISKTKPAGGHSKTESKSEKERKPTSVSLLTQSSQESANALLTLYPLSNPVAVEWRDALRYLTGTAPGEETVSFTKRLAEVSVRVKLLDIVAGGVEIPAVKPLIDGVSMEDGVAGKVAITGEFWYDNMVD